MTAGKTSTEQDPSLHNEVTYRFLAESLPQFVWISAADGTLDYCNPHALEYLRLPAQQAQRGGWMSAIFPADLPELLRQRDISPAHHEPFELELRIRRGSDGAYRWHIVRANPFCIAGEWKWLGTALDIDDRKQTESTGALLASIVESSTDAVVGLDRNGVISSWNPAAAELFGYSTKEAVGWPGHTLNPTEGAEARFNAVLARALAGERVEWIDSSYRTRSGAELALQCAITAIRGADGSTIAAFQTFRNITESRAIERDLIAANERLRLVQRTVKAGTWEIDISTGLLYRSPELHELYGVSPALAPAPETDWTRFVHPEDVLRVRAAINSAIRDRSELRLQYRAQLNGETRWVTAVGSVIETDDTPRIVGITLDTTDFQNAEEAMRQAARLDSIGRLAGGIAHDFNNLLAGILGGASFIAEVLPHNHSARPMLDLVIRSSERAAHLTQQLLAYSGKGNFVLRQTDISRVVEDAFPLLRGAVPQNVELVLQCNWTLPAVDADANQIRETVLSLVSNAGEAIDSKEGTVWVRTGLEQRVAQAGATSANFVYLEVKDDGPGIDPAIQNRIFEPFFTTRFTGRGLGLAAVEGIVRSHNGVVKVRSQPGEGSAFRILFPVSASSAVPPRLRAPGKTTGATVLVIDDEEAVRDVVCAKLQHSGYKVLLARDGRSGLEQFRASRDSISLVILDIGMPGMSGAQVFDEFISSGIDVPVVITSGYREAEALAHIQPNRIAGFLQKPFNVRDLSQLVEKLAVAR